MWRAAIVTSKDLHAYVLDEVGMIEGTDDSRDCVDRAKQMERHKHGHEDELAGT